MENEMVERAARAISSTYGDIEDICGEPAWRLWIDEACAAIRAITSDGSTILPAGHVKTPTSAQEARMMCLLGKDYLEQAPLLEALSTTQETKA